MKAIVLAAGEGKRLRPLTNTVPKCLLPYKDTTILQRLIYQIKKHGIEEIIVVVGYQKNSVINKIKKIKGIKIAVNDRYKTDTNIYSMFLAVNKAMDNKVEDVVVFEADMIAEDNFIDYITGTDFENKSVWFTNGKFKSNQNGGILITDGKGNVIDIKIVDKYSREYDRYDKLTGVMRIAPSELAIFHKLLEKYSARTISQYYLIPWMENIRKLPSVKGEASHYLFATFNTPEDYEKIKDIDFVAPVVDRDVYLIEASKLHPLESHNNRRVPFIKKMIIKNGFWEKPLRIEKNHNLVLDGHHSLELAKQMKLRLVPVIGFDYDEVKMWSLREEIPLDKETVIKNAKNSKIYPYKTVKHKFPNVKCKCKIRVDRLA